VNGQKRAVFINLARKQIEDILRFVFFLRAFKQLFYLAFEGIIAFLNAQLIERLKIARGRDKSTPRFDAVFERFYL
jgi:hypothetical protein